MVKVDFQSYSDYIYICKDCKCGKVYPLSIAEEYQYGDIFVKSRTECNTVLFWHYSGFAFLLGEYDEGFLIMSTLSAGIFLNIRIKTVI